MKTRTYVSILILVLAVLIISGGYVAGQDGYMVKEDEELFGVWFNPDYANAAKLIIKHDGAWVLYRKGDNDIPYFNGPTASSTALRISPFLTTSESLFRSS